MKTKEVSSKNYVLLGYMGSGKSTVGQELAVALSLRFVDLDNFIESQENASVSKIIEDKGIIYFRKIEQEHLKVVLHEANGMVISLGGGTPCYYNTMEMLHKIPNMKSFYLRATVPFLTQRLFKEKDHRPLIASQNTTGDLAEFIGKHLLERSAFYSQAHYSINIQDKTPQEIAQEIAVLG